MVGALPSAEFRSREMRAADIPRCARILAEKCPYEGYESAAVNQSWPRLLEAGRMKAAVAQGGQGTIIAFGASVFLTSQFARRLLSNPTPFIGRQITESAFTAPPPICTVDEIAKSNANSGLSVFILHSGVSEVHGRTEQFDIKAQLMSAFLQLHRGYRVSNVLVEAYGPEEQLLYKESSFRLVDDYSSFRDWNSLPGKPGAPRPSLFGLFRNEVIRMTTHPLLPLFVYHHPRCGFNANEQHLLREALKGHTDEELAVQLNLSLSAIKKRWIKIFEKAESCLPDAMSPGGLLRDAHVRGVQRRHMLLRELRARPEELTPYPRQKATQHGHPSYV